MNTPKVSSNSSHPNKPLKTASPLQHLQHRIQQSKQKLHHLKTIQNPSLLHRVRTLQKQIQRLSIINVQQGSLEANKLLLKEFAIAYHGESDLLEVNDNNNSANTSVMKLSFLKQAKELTFVSRSQVPTTQQLSSIEQLEVLRNVTTQAYHDNLANSPNKHEKYTTKHKAPNNDLTLLTQKQFFPAQQITQLSQRLLPTVLQSQTYPLLNRYLTSKSSLLSKLIQLNPQKRNNNSLLISHQRVILKQHLDMTRRIAEDLIKKNQQLQNQIDRDFVMVRNKWEESEREVRKLGKISKEQGK